MFRSRLGAPSQFFQSAGAGDDIKYALHTSRIHNPDEFDNYRIKREAIVAAIRRDRRDRVR